MTEDSSIVTETDSIIARIEALLFVAAGSVTIAQIATALNLPAHTVEQAINTYSDSLNKNINFRGLRLQRHHGRIQLTTPPEMAEDVERFLGLEISNRLSRAALETLAIIAYQQPVTRPEIDAIRGVSSDGVLKSLLSKGLLEEIGRAERPGRPILYATTPDFLSHFGLYSLEELPPLALELLSQEN